MPASFREMRCGERHTSSVFQSPGLGDHCILLGDSSSHVVDIPRVVDLPGQCAGFVGSLLTSENMEVIVCGMTTSVAFGTNSRTKDDQVPGGSAQFSDFCHP